MEIELPEPFSYFCAMPCGFEDCRKNDDGAFPLYDEASVRQAIAAAVAKEREVCAKACEEMAEQTLAKQDGEIEQVDLNLRLIAIAGQKPCADAIRARGETPCN